MRKQRDWRGGSHCLTDRPRGEPVLGVPIAAGPAWSTCSVFSVSSCSILPPSSRGVCIHALEPLPDKLFELLRVGVELAYALGRLFRRHRIFIQHPAEFLLIQ